MHLQEEFEDIRNGVETDAMFSYTTCNAIHWDIQIQD